MDCGYPFKWIVFFIFLFHFHIVSLIIRMTDAFGGARNQVRPPERGIFPLDHDGECKKDMKIYVDCLKSNSSDHFACRAFSKGYLQCRMNHELMAKEDINNLGLGDSDKVYIRKTHDKSKETEGYVAGLDVKSSRKWLFQR